MRSVDAQAQAFESALKSNLAEVFVASDTAAQSVTGAPVNVLGVEATRPDAMKLSDRQSRGIAPPINLGALAFLLWDRLADEVPNLVDRLCPNSRSGMKSADRKQALDKLNADLAALEAERDTLQGELHAARQVVANGQGY